MARQKMTDVLLEREWDGHAAGQIVTVERMTADSMINKNYGRFVTSAEKKEMLAEVQPIETADAPPQTESPQANLHIETADALPQSQKTAAKGKKGGKN